MSSMSLVGVARGLELWTWAAASAVLLDLHVLSSAILWLSGMKTATKSAHKTAQAPNRKGGPGMKDFYGSKVIISN